MDSVFIVPNRPIHRAVMKKLLRGVDTKDVPAMEGDFSYLTNCSNALITTMYGRKGQEQLDRIGSEKDRLMSLFCANIRQILDMRTRRAHDTINMLVHSARPEDTLRDLQKLRIHEAPARYQYFCRKLSISSFVDLLTMANKASSSSYYVVQGANFKLCSMNEVMKDSIVRTLLQYSAVLDVLAISVDDIEDDLDMDMEGLLDMLGGGGGDETRDFTIIDDLIADILYMTNPEKVHQQIFTYEQSFADADIQTKMKLLLGQLRHGNKQVYDTLVQFDLSVFLEKKTITLPLYVTSKNIGFYKVVEKDTGAQRYDLNISSPQQPEQVMVGSDVMKCLYTSFLIYFVQEYFRSGADFTHSVQLALEKFIKFAQSKDIELVLTF